MSQSQNLINSVEDEEHSVPLLVTECTKSWAESHLYDRIYKSYDQGGCEVTPEILGNRISPLGLFWSIAFPPNLLIPNRGKVTTYDKCSTGVQFHYIKKCILLGNWWCLRHSFFIIEYTKENMCHLHILTTSEANLQDQRAEILFNFELLDKKYKSKIVCKERKVDNIFKAIAYFFKRSLSYVPNRSESSIHSFNEMIENKSYEITKYNLFYID